MLSPTVRATSTADSNSVARADGNAISIALSPLGHLYLEGAGPDEVVPEAPAAKRIARAFERGTGAGLFHLGAVEVAIPLPPAFAFWRDFGRSFVTALCGVPDLEEKRDAVELAAPPEEIAALVRSAPPMQGGEYLRAEVLEALWAEMLAPFRLPGELHDWAIAAGPPPASAARRRAPRVRFRPRSQSASRVAGSRSPGGREERLRSRVGGLPTRLPATRLD